MRIIGKRYMSILWCFCLYSWQSPNCLICWVSWLCSCLVCLFIHIYWPFFLLLLPLSCWEAYLNFPTGRYKVFLGHKQYFVSLNVGVGKMQWYGFHQEPAGGADILNGKWSYCVWDLISVRAQPLRMLSILGAPLINKA